MLLQREELHRVIKDRPFDQRLTVMPLLQNSQIGPASLDIRLATEFRLLRRTEEAGLDPGAQVQATAERRQELVRVEIGNYLWLHPGQFILGSTLEFFRFPTDLGGYVVGRSSWGRVGLLIATAIMVQPGFSGTLTLELVNHGDAPIALYPGSRIGQLTVHQLVGPTSAPYGGKYVGPVGPEVSRLNSERAEIAHLHDVATRLEH